MRLVYFVILFLVSTQIYGQQWVQKASMPLIIPARNHPVTFAIGEFGYVVTGNTPLGFSNDFLRYNTQTNQWQVLPDFPGDRRGYAYGTAYDGKGYVGFGVGDFDYNDLWRYDPATGAWEELTPCPCPGRRHPAFAESGGKIYVGLGDNLNLGNLNDFWAYDIATDTWEELPDFPSHDRHHPYYFSIGKNIYVGMGHGNAVVDDWVVYKDLYKYDTENGTWTGLNDFPGEARVAGTQFTYNGKGYILHGEGEDHALMEDGEFWEYTPADDTWLQLTSAPGGSRWAPGTFVVNNTVYSVAGSTFNYVDKRDLWSYQFAPVSSTTDVPEGTSISISPNPITDHIRLNLPASEQVTNEPVRYEIWTPDGKHCHSGTTQSNIIHMDFLKEGSYLLQLTNDQFTQTLRFVKI